MSVHDEPVSIEPQEGPQEDFLATRADIAFYGGAAGGGKSFALTIDPLRHHDNKDFRAVLFRRETPQITNPGGLWDEMSKVYSLFGAKPNQSKLTWQFPNGMEVKAAHMQLETDKLSWQGSQMAYIGFDEVTHFSQSMFFYMMSRLRSMSGVPGHMRATCNPDPDSWVASFLEWWINQETGYPIPERAGKLRWFIRQGESFIWGDTRKELIEKYGTDQLPKSVTFIPAKVTDNKILLANDPDYLSNLRSMDRVDRARLEGGNWLVRASAGDYFQRAWFEVVDALPTNIVRQIRYWDRAATVPSDKNKDPDWTVGFKLVQDGYGMFYIADIERFRARPLEVKQRIRAIATQDGIKCRVGIEQDPGQAGVSESDDMLRYLAGFICDKYPVTTKKEIRAKPFSSQCQAGNVKVLRGKWNKAWFDEGEAFPTDGVHDDQIDAGSGAFNAMMGSGNTLKAMTKM